MSYHGELEKKAAMEQKRTLTGDEEGNGSGSGISNYILYLLSECSQRKKKKKKKKNDHHEERNKKALVPLIHPLSIPDVFIPKPVPPLVIHRTGKVWSKKESPRMSVDHSEEIVTLNPSTTTFGLPLTRAIPNDDSLSSSRDSLVHSVSSRFQAWLDATGDAEPEPRSSSDRLPCRHCLIDVNYLAQGDLLWGRAASSDLTWLADVLPSSVFQHVLVWMG